MPPKPPSNVVPFRKPPSGGPRVPSIRLPAWLTQMTASVTGWIVLANATVWLTMVIASLGSGILTRFPASTTWAFGALVPDQLASEPWRLVTCTFVHGDLMHMAMNMAILWFVGRRLEYAYGAARFGALYLGAGLAGSVASAGWHVMTSGTSVGASGAVLGVIGGIAAFYWKARGRRSDETRQWLGFCAMSVGIGVVLSMFGVPVDNAAHVGGMLGGAGLSWAFAGRRPWVAGAARGVLGGIAVLVGGSFALALVLGNRLPAAETDARRVTTLAEAEEALLAGDPAEAEARLARAVADTPDDPFLRLFHAKSLRTLGREEDARAELHAADALLAAMARAEPANAAIHVTQAEVLSALGRKEDAGAALDRALKGSGDAETLARLARQLDAAGRIDEAVAAAYRARQLDGRYVELHQGLREKRDGGALSATPAASATP